MDIAAIAACLDVKDAILIAPKPLKQAASIQRRFSSPTSDHIQLLNVFYAYMQIRGKLKEDELRSWCYHYFISFTGIRQAHQVFSDYSGFLESKEDHPQGTCSQIIDGHRNGNQRAKCFQAYQPQCYWVTISYFLGCFPP
ncbi:hypothetical protein F4680DRAFT_103395 [Xylaria scruposa]|nr:hypothetical protein F4680DRAFT_103395 [Xylaria scruposa]